MPKVDFGTSDDISQVAGIGKDVLSKLNSGVYPGINYKVHKISDIKLKDYEKLPREAYLTITHTAGRQYTRSEVEQIAKFVRKRLKIQALITGSYRRGLELLNDVDLLTTNHKHSIEEDKNIIIIRNGDTQIKLLVRLKNGQRSRFMTSKDEYIPTDILITTEEQYPFALMHFTGSKEFNQKIRAHAKSMGMKLNQYGLYKHNTRLPGLTTEKKIFAALGMKYLEPENRS